MVVENIIFFTAEQSFSRFFYIEVFCKVLNTLLKTFKGAKFNSLVYC